MTGTAGSKTVSLESKEAGAVMMVARAVYYGYFVHLEDTSVGQLSIHSPDLASNPVISSAVEKAARRLTEIEVDVG
jgi:hypothetical protein